jgi:hypothetical protein
MYTGCKRYLQREPVKRIIDLGREFPSTQFFVKNEQTFSPPTNPIDILPIRLKGSSAISDRPIA